MKKSGYSVQISFFVGAVPESGMLRESRNKQRTEEKTYRNPVRRKNLGTAGDQRQVVPKSGTPERIRKQAAIRKKVVPESGTPERIWEQAANGRKMYRNPVRGKNLGTVGDQKKNVPESGTQGEPRNGR